MLKKNFHRIGSLALILFLLGFSLLSIAQLPIKGMADNGDFWRVTNASGFTHAQPIDLFRGDYVQQYFLYQDIKWSDFISSASLVGLFARMVYRAFNPRSRTFDLRMLGILYLCLLAIAIYLLARATGSGALAAAILWVLVDPNYLLFFNSFYVEPILFVMVIGLLGVILVMHKEVDHSFRRPLLSILIFGLSFGTLALLSGLAKPSYVLIPAILSICLITSPGFRKRFTLKRFTPLVTPTLIASFIVPVFFLFPKSKSPLHYIYDINNFNCLFFGIAKVSSHPEEVFRDLKIPERYWSLKGENFFHVDPKVHTDDLNKSLRSLSRTRILFHYLIDPKASFEAFKSVYQALLTSRLRYPGHLSKEAKLGRSEYVVPWQFSVPRDGLIKTTLVVPALVIGFAMIWLIYLAIFKRRWMGVQVVELFLLLNILSQMVISVLGDGLFSLGRHLIFARFCLDLLIVFLFWDVMLYFWRRTSLNNIKQKR